MVAHLLANDALCREAAGLRPGDPAPDVATVRRWVQDADWPARWQQTMADAAPFSLRIAALRIATAAPGAAATLAHLATTSERLGAGDRVRADAAKAILGMTLGDTIADHARAMVNHTVDMSKLHTIEDLEAAEKALTEGMQ